jgi:oligopeptide/dipeptide ABC transporter ATP-binding protein
LKAARWESQGGEDLWEIPGTVPSPLDLPPGCAFAPRCAEVVPRCRQEKPQLGKAAGREVRCFVAQEGRR